MLANDGLFLERYVKMCSNMSKYVNGVFKFMFNVQI